MRITVYVPSTQPSVNGDRRRLKRITIYVPITQPSVNGDRRRLTRITIQVPIKQPSVNGDRRRLMRARSNLFEYAFASKQNWKRNMSSSQSHHLDILSTVFLCFILKITLLIIQPSLKQSQYNMSVFYSEDNTFDNSTIT